MVDKKRADQISGGVFLIGLALIAMLDFWWPGIMFVIGASAMARGVAEGQDWYNVPGGLWMIGIGLVFLFNFSWPMILILVGVSMLFGQSWHRQSQRGQQSQPEAELISDPPEKAKHDTYIVEDDDDVASVEELLRREKRKNS